MAVCGERSENRRRGMNKLCKVVIASDFSGFNLKEAVKKYLMFAGHAVEDVGQINPEDRVLYYEAASSLQRHCSPACARGGL
jgi:ribose 5-phosphate isomerase B